MREESVGVSHAPDTVHVGGRENNRTSGYVQSIECKRDRIPAFLK